MRKILLALAFLVISGITAILINFSVGVDKETMAQTGTKMISPVGLEVIRQNSDEVMVGRGFLLPVRGPRLDAPEVWSMTRQEGPLKRVPTKVLEMSAKSAMTGETVQVVLRQQNGSDSWVGVTNTESATSPDGRSIAFVLQDGIWVYRDGESWPKRLTPDIVDGKTREQWLAELPGYPYWAANIAWTPDGRTIVYRSSLPGTGNDPSGSIWNIPVEGGTPRLLVKALPNQFLQIRGFLSTGELAYLANHDLVALDVEKGASRLIASQVSNIYPSPDGKTFLLANVDNDINFVLKLVSGEEHAFPDLPKGFRWTGLPSWSKDGQRVAFLAVNGETGEVLLMVFQTTPVPVLLKSFSTPHQDYKFFVSPALAWIDSNSLLARLEAKDDPLVITTWKFTIGQ